MPNKSKLEYALEYQRLGWSIIPTKKDKTPYLISWKEYQNIIPSAEQITMWWNAWPDANPAVVTGKISNIVALDLDAKHNRKSSEFKIPPTVCAKSGGGGEHFFFRYPGVPIESKSAISGPGVDIRADGGYILLSPSVNSGGGIYEWTVPIESKEDLAEMPVWFLELVTNSNSNKKWLIGKEGVSEGSRNDTAASMVGKLLSNMDSSLWEGLGWDLLKTWNNKNLKPLAEKELRSVWESIMKRHLIEVDTILKTDSSTQADKLINIIETNKSIILFHDDFKEPYISIPRDNHQEIWRCSSGQLKDWLSKIYWEKNKKAPNSDALNTALNVIKGKARFDGPEITLFNRTAFKNGNYWYDMAGRDWKAVKINEDGWNIIDNPPIIFRRYNHQKTQVAPEVGGEIRDILKYVNIKDIDQQILFLVWIVSCYIPNFPHPVPYVYGQKGSAKSTISKIVRELVDPSLLDVISFPKNEAELIQILSHNWTVFFDNVSQISESVSDLLCRAVTGGSFSKRKLYTDDEDVICTFRSCLGINGINLMAVKPDLLQRSILFELSPIPESEKIEEQVLWSEFERKKPGIIGAIFDALVKTINKKKDIKLMSSPRMADFTSWGCAIAESIGYTQDEFLSAYYRNINSQNMEVLYEDPVASLIQEFMEDKEEWNGTATKLLESLNFMATTEVSKILPKAPNKLSNYLTQIKSNLETIGINISKEDNNKGRKIIIKKSQKGLPGKENKKLELLSGAIDDNIDTF